MASKAWLDGLKDCLDGLKAWLDVMKAGDGKRWQRGGKEVDKVVKCHFGL